jgi:hypothetical protein
VVHVNVDIEGVTRHEGTLRLISGSTFMLGIWGDLGGTIFVGVAGGDVAHLTIISGWLDAGAVHDNLIGASKVGVGGCRLETHKK